MTAATAPVSIITRILRFFAGLILLAMILVTLVPYLFNFAMFKSMSGEMPGWVISAYATFLAFLVSLSPFSFTSYPAVELGPNKVYPRAQILEQRKTSVNTDKIAHLRIVGVSYADRKSSFNLEKGTSVSGQASVHLGARADRAVVFITNDNIRWSFTGAGQVGFHGATPLEIRTPPAGMTVELRLYEKTRDGLSGALNAVNAPSNVRGTFCSAIRGWQRHYELYDKDVDYVELVSPNSIMINENSVMADGRFGTYFSGQTLKSICG